MPPKRLLFGLQERINPSAKPRMRQQRSTKLSKRTLAAYLRNWRSGSLLVDDRRKKTAISSDGALSRMIAPQPITELTEASARSLRPVDDFARIIPVDVLRGVALLGILLMNIQSFSMIGAAYFNPTAYGDLHGANWWVWLLCHILADQKFMTIFSMLFGAGILLMTQHIEAKGLPPARLHYRRMGWLILFGLLHGFLLWDGDILYAYGMSGLAVFLLRKIAPGKQLLLAGLLLAIGSGVSLASYYSMPWWPAAQRQELERNIWQPTAEEEGREIAAYRGSFASAFHQRAQSERGNIVQAFFFLEFWRVAGLMLAGMAVFKLGIFSAKASRALYTGMILAAVLIGIPLILYGVHQEIKSGWSFGYSFFLAAQYNYLASILVSFGWIGMVMLACKSGWWLAYTGRLGAIGRMAFSNYILHTLICTTLFYGYGLGQFGKVARTTQLEIVVVIWILQLVISPMWLEKFRYGPLEWLWRSLTYGKRQPFLRAI
jgi:uncharacterized protein